MSAGVRFMICGILCVPLLRLRTFCVFFLVFSAFTPIPFKLSLMFLFYFFFSCSLSFFLFVCCVFFCVSCLVFLFSFVIFFPLLGSGMFSWFFIFLRTLNVSDFGRPPHLLYMQLPRLIWSFVFRWPRRRFAGSDFRLLGFPPNFLGAPLSGSIFRDVSNKTFLCQGSLSDL